jgi:hypothetical protein
MLSFDTTRTAYKTKKKKSEEIHTVSKMTS